MDIDSDFRTDIRARVVEYCKAKYGAECICQIMTKAYGATKGNLRLASRYIGSREYEKKYGEDVEQTELVKEETEGEEEQEILINPKLKEFLKQDGWYSRADKLAKMYDEGRLFDEDGTPILEGLSDEEIEILQIASTLDGVFTNYGQHAAGTIISGDDLSGIIPLMWNTKKGDMETQCSMAQAEAKGLLKMDFLGLENLDIITEIIRHPSGRKEMDGRLQDYVEREKIFKDPVIYQNIFCTGRTQGIFQFESPGMKNMLMKFKPESFEDLIVLVAAYRPGPMDYIPEIIASKWLEKYKDNPKAYEEFIKSAFPFSKEEYLEKKEAGLAYFYDEHGNVLPYIEHSISLQNEALQEILAPTYGCPIYQEQIMKIFQEMAGYSLGGADIVRRFMSKKKVDKLAKEKQAFIYGDEKRGIPGCIKKHGITEEEADKLFEQMMPFSLYGFNKSHATAYAMVSLFTAYLKQYRTADFFRSSLNHIKELKDIVPFVAEMPSFGLEFVRPTLKDSKNDFTTEDDKAVRYGLRHIKGFSEQNIQPSKTIQGFMELNPHVSKSIVEKYIMLGMFEGCWKSDERSGKLHKNRHEGLRWLEKNGDTFIAYRKCIEKADELSVEIAELENSLIMANSEEQTTEIKKTIASRNRSLMSTTEKRKALAAELNQNHNEDRMRFIPRETDAEILENRAWEVELLSIPFEIEDSMKRVSNCTNKNTFDDLLTSSEQQVRIPAIVLTISAQKTTKKGMTYYDVTLMDRNRNIITRRFDTPPTVLDGEFFLHIEDKKFFTSKTKDTKKIFIEYEKVKTYLPQNASAQEIATAIKFGGGVENIKVAGNVTVPTVYTYTDKGERE